MNQWSAQTPEQLARAAKPASGSPPGFKPRRLPFPETGHCKSRLHCKACRNNSRFRQSLIQTLGAFDCPLNLPIGEDDKLPAFKLTQQPHPTCRYATILKELFLSGRPCKGRKIKCTNPECPIDFWYEAGCNAQRCRFFTSIYAREDESELP